MNDTVTRDELEARIAELEQELERSIQHGLGIQLRGHKFTVVVNDVLGELNAAMKKYERFNSAHEGFAVLLEEVDELWEEVKAKGVERSHKTMYGEAKQVAAMALRFMIDVCGEKAGSAG